MIENTDSALENFTCKNKSLPNSIDDIISTLMGDASTLKTHCHPHPEYDGETICISVREAIFLKKGIRSHLNQPLVSVYAPGFSTCALLHMQNTISNESFTVHVDTDCALNLNEIISLFDNKEEFKVSLSFFRFDHVNDDTTIEFIDKNLNVFNKSSRLHSIEESLRVLKNTITTFSNFLNGNKNCKIDIHFTNYFFKDITQSGSFILNLEEGIAYVDISTSQAGLTGKYYPSVDRQNIMGKPIHNHYLHLRDLYVHRFYGTISILKSTEVMIIYNNKTKQNLLPTPYEKVRFDNIREKIFSLGEQKAVMRMLFDLCKEESLPYSLFNEFFDVFNNLEIYVKKFPLHPPKVSLAPYSTFYNNTVTEISANQNNNLIPVEILPLNTSTTTTTTTQISAQKK